MKFEINEYRFNDKVSVYYQEDLYCSLAKEIIGFVWLGKGANRDRFKLIKDDFKGKVYKYNGKNEIYYLKCYAHRKPDKIIKNFFRPVEGIRHFRTANRLLAKNIPVVKPVLGLTLKQNPFIKDSIFVTKGIKNTNLVEGLQIAGDKEGLRSKIIKEIAKIFGQVTLHNFLNQDPSLYNILINYIDKDKELFKLSLVDVDNIYQYPLLPRKLILDNLSKFISRLLADIYRNKIKPLNYKERRLFLVEYFKHAGLPINLDVASEIVEKKAIKRLMKSGNKKIVTNDIVLGNKSIKFKNERW